VDINLSHSQIQHTQKYGHTYLFLFVEDKRRLDEKSFIHPIKLYNVFHKTLFNYFAILLQNIIKTVANLAKLMFNFNMNKTSLF